jgi:hypothetical protein
VSPLNKVPPPIRGDSVELTEGVEKMMGVIFAHILDTKVVNYQGESDRTGVVGSQGGGSRDGTVSILGKVKGELVVGNTAGLFEAWHPLSDLHVDPAVISG